MELRGIVETLILHKSHLFFAADIWVVGVFGGQAWWGLWWSSRRLAAWVEHVHNCVRDSDTGPRPLPLLYLLSPFVHPGQKSDTWSGRERKTDMPIRLPLDPRSTWRPFFCTVFGLCLIYLIVLFVCLPKICLSARLVQTCQLIFSFYLSNFRLFFHRFL